MTAILETIIYGGILLLAFMLVVVAHDCFVWAFTPCSCEACEEQKQSQRLSTPNRQK